MGHPTNERQEVLHAYQAVFLDTPRVRVHWHLDVGSHRACPVACSAPRAVSAAPDAADAHNFSGTCYRSPGTGGRWGPDFLAGVDDQHANGKGEDLPHTWWAGTLSLAY